MSSAIAWVCWTIRGAFAEGRLSYSQVRALTRVENVAQEEELLSLARHATASQLERLVRAYRGVVARAQAASYGGPERYVTWDAPSDIGAARVFQYRLAGDPNAAWTTAQVVALSNNRVGVNVQLLDLGDYEYRITHTRIGSTEPHLWHNFCDAVDRPDLKAAQLMPGEALRGPRPEQVEAKT